MESRPSVSVFKDYFFKTCPLFGCAAPTWHNERKTERASAKEFIVIRLMSVNCTRLLSIGFLVQTF